MEIQRLEYKIMYKPSIILRSSSWLASSRSPPNISRGDRGERGERGDRGDRDGGGDRERDRSIFIRRDMGCTNGDVVKKSCSPGSILGIIRPKRQKKQSLDN